MSKYIKLEDAIHNINLEVTGRKEYTGDMKANLFFALDDLPTIEVSEDCISREDAVNALIAHFIPQTYTGEEVEQAIKLARKIMANAPSVVPTTEQSSKVDIVHCRDCKWWTKQSHSIQGRCELGGILYPTGEWFCANGERTEE